jgi:hypothetical protein
VIFKIVSDAQVSRACLIEKIDGSIWKCGVSKQVKHPGKVNGTSNRTSSRSLVDCASFARRKVRYGGGA